MSGPSPENGLVGVLAQETARYSMFAASLCALSLPAGWEVKFWFGHDIACNANELVRELYRQEKQWLWLMGDDHVFSPDLLERLLAHGERLVAPLCLLRNPPYRPVIFRESGGQLERVDLATLGHPAGGLLEIGAAGGAGLLVHRDVFDAVQDPWFEAGVDSSVQLGEDIRFCRKARAAGFRVYCDLEASLGHCTTSVVWPVHEPDGWTFGFSMLGGFQVTMPPGFQAYADQVAAEPAAR